MKLIFNKYLDETNFLGYIENKPILVTVINSPINRALLDRLFKRDIYWFNFLPNESDFSQGQIIVNKKEKNKKESGQIFSMGCAWKELSGLDLFELELKHL